MEKKIIVIGGGISGLTTAYLMKKKGFNVKLYEKSSAFGGSIKSKWEEGFLVEYGPNSTVETTPLIDELLNMLGIKEKKIYASEKASKRYILRNGKIIPLPMNPIKFLNTGLFSKKAKLRLFKEPFVKSKSHPLESIAEFTKRRLGQEFLDYAIDPFVSGVYAGNPEKINVKTAFPRLYDLEQKYGSLITGSIKSRKERKNNKEKAKNSGKIISLENGLQELTDSICNDIKDISFSSTEAVEIKKEEKGYSIVFKNKNNEIINDFADIVVLSSPTYSVSNIISGIDKDLSSKIKNIYYPPVSVAVLGFREKDISKILDGFGFLIPKKENKKILGTLWSSTIFENRAPKNFALLTNYLGGSRAPELFKLSDEEKLELTFNELKSIIGIKDRPVFSKIINHEKAIPQYDGEYPEIYDKLNAFLDKNKGLFFCNNFYKGISVSDCIKNAFDTTENVEKYLKI